MSGFLPFHMARSNIEMQRKRNRDGALNRQENKKFWEEFAMLNTIFSSVFTETTAAFTFGQFLACTAVSLILGLLIAAVYRYKSECTKSFAVTLVLMPAIVQMVIMLVNRNLGTGVP